MNQRLLPIQWACILVVVVSVTIGLSPFLIRVHPVLVGVLPILGGVFCGWGFRNFINCRQRISKENAESFRQELRNNRFANWGLYSIFIGGPIGIAWMLISSPKNPLDCVGATTTFFVVIAGAAMIVSHWIRCVSGWIGKLRSDKHEET